MKPNKTLLILLISLLSLAFSVHIDCPHDKQNLNLDVDENNTEDPFDGRMLQSDYDNIRIYVDYSLLDSTLAPEVQAYIKNELMPPVVNYYQQLLKVIPRAKKLTYKKDTICGIPTPAIFKDTGVDADIAFIIDASFEADSNYIAYARACSIQNGDKRPTFGNAHFNLKYVKIGNEKTHNENLLVALHELAHVFGISKGLFEYYYDPVTASTRQGHVISKDIGGMTSFLVDVEPLTTKLRDFFSCPTLEGALLENEGEAMSASHLERRVFYSEIMTAGEMEEARISEFMLAFLEGTGWYKGNYSMTEPVYWGKGKGCDFYYSPCIDRATFNPNFEEFCPTLAETGCSVTRKLGASCGASSKKTSNDLDQAFNYWGNGLIVGDMFADNCPYFVPNSNKDCEDATSQMTAFLQEEAYGTGSKCFSGTLMHPGQVLNAKTNYCFKTTCDLQPDGRFFLQVKIGSASVTCMKSGSVGVAGFVGQIDCPDPSEYCSTYGKPFCERGCMGKGQCVNSQCVCDDGWGGSSCGMKVLSIGCKRCASDPLEKACFGDSCVCDPSDRACTGNVVFDDSSKENGSATDTSSGSTGSTTTGDNGGISTGTGSNTGNGASSGTGTSTNTNTGSSGTRGGSSSSGSKGGKSNTDLDSDDERRIGSSGKVMSVVQALLVVLGFVMFWC